MSNTKPNKEIRCISCNNVIAKGDMKIGCISIPCKNCKTINIIEAAQPDLPLLSDYGHVSVLKGDELTKVVIEKENERFKSRRL